MTVTTDEFWTVDGVPLNTLAFNIRTLGGSRSGVPPLRGGNVTVPYRPGDRWVPKMPGSRTLTLMMWVKGADADGRVPFDFRAMFNDNWRMLKTLFWRTDRQITLTKRWRSMDGTITEATALAEFGGGLEPEMFSPGMASFSVDLVLADPFFYATERTQVTVPDVPSVSNPGDDVVRFMTVDFDGGANYRLRNETNNVTLRVEEVEGPVSIDTETFRATASGVPIMDKVFVDGPRGVPYWFLLAPGNNRLSLESGGTATLTYRPVYT